MERSLVIIPHVSHITERLCINNQTPSQWGGRRAIINSLHKKPQEEPFSLDECLPKLLLGRLVSVGVVLKAAKIQTRARALLYGSDVSNYLVFRPPVNSPALIWNMSISVRLHEM